MKNNKNNSKFYSKFLFILMFLAVLVLVFYITRPFLPALLTGAIIAYLSYPFYRKILKFIANRNLAAFAFTVVLVLVLTIPFITIVVMISKEAYSTYVALKDQNLGTNFYKVVCQDENSFSCSSLNSLMDFFPKKNPDYFLQTVVGKISLFVYDNAYELLTSIPSILLNLFVMVFIIYYLLKDGERIAKRIRNILPLKESHKQHVFDRFHSITFAVFYGNLSIAVMQGILGIIGFALLGVKSPVLWGLVMMIFALVPYFGTAIIWLPAALNLILSGYLQSNNSLIIKGIILVLYGAFIIGTIDNILKPKLIGHQAKVHPITVLLGVLGGLNFFGFLGFILGPVIISLLMILIDIYEEEKDEFT